MPRSRPTLVDEHTKYLEPSAVADDFLYVTKQITKLFESHDPSMLIEKCEAIMASDVHNIKFFSKDQIEQLKEYSSTPLLLQGLRHLWSWSNHSVLRVLVESCDEAIELLDGFDCCLNLFKPIASYPMSKIEPTNPTTQTVLTVMFTEDMSGFTLQDVFDMYSLVMKKCGITCYCPQLLSATQGFVTIHLSVPTCLVDLISKEVLQYRSYFCSMGILEVGIYPNVKIIVGEAANCDVSQIYQYIHIRTAVLVHFLLSVTNMIA